MEKHIPVLQKELINFFDLNNSKGTLLDATFGTGGHARMMTEAMGDGIFVGIDADEDALKRAEKEISYIKKQITSHIVNDNFRNISKISKDLGISKYDFIISDLGWGSHQIESGRGFSFQKDETLNMCYSTKENGCVVNALDVVNTFEEKPLAQLIKEFGEERWATRIAKFIVTKRKENPITTTKQLSEIISQAIPRKLQPKKINVATKTFQAIRIVVNDEINALEQFLMSIKSLSGEGTKLAIISFHSLEDRLIKETFKEWTENEIGRCFNKKVTKPSASECLDNPRSRSAKLRTFIFN